MESRSNGDGGANEVTSSAPGDPIVEPSPQPPKTARTKLPKAGDVLSVGHYDGALVVGHYLGGPPEGMPLVTFYRCPLDWEVSGGLGDCKVLFGPIIVGVNPPVRSGRWTIIGRVDPGPYRLPGFLQGGPTRGVPVANWWLSRNGKSKPLGKKVPKRYRHLEMDQVWPAELIEERIETGVNVFDYEAHIRWGNTPPDANHTWVSQNPNSHGPRKNDMRSIVNRRSAWIILVLFVLGLLFVAAHMGVIPLRMPGADK